MLDRGTIKQNAKDAFKKNVGTCILVYLVSIIVSIIVTAITEEPVKPVEVNSVQTFLTTVQAGMKERSALLSVIVGFIITLPFNVGISKFYLEQYRHGNADFKLVFSGYNNNFLKNIAIQFLAMIPAFALTLVFLVDLIFFGISLNGTLNNAKIELCIITSIIMLVLLVCIFIYTYAIFLLDFYMAEGNYSVIGAVKTCISDVKGHKGELFICSLSFIPWLLLVAITCGLAVFFVGPYMMMTFAGYFDELYTNEAMR